MFLEWTGCPHPSPNFSSCATGLMKKNAETAVSVRMRSFLKACVCICTIAALHAEGSY